jgi:hypothetical protein
VGRLKVGARGHRSCPARMSALLISCDAPRGCWGSLYEEDSSASCVWPAFIVRQGSGLHRSACVPRSPEHQQYQEHSPWQPISMQSCLSSSSTGGQPDAVRCGCRANDSGTVSETFRAALDATAVRVSWRRSNLDDPGSDKAADAARGGIRYNLWAALIQTHLPMIVSVRSPR